MPRITYFFLRTTRDRFPLQSSAAEVRRGGRRAEGPGDVDGSCNRVRSATIKMKFVASRLQNCLKHYFDLPIEELVHLLSRYKYVVATSMSHSALLFNIECRVISNA